MWTYLRQGNVQADYGNIETVAQDLGWEEHFKKAAK